MCWWQVAFRDEWCTLGSLPGKTVCISPISECWCYPLNFFAERGLTQKRKRAMCVWYAPMKSQKITIRYSNSHAEIVLWAELAGPNKLRCLLYLSATRLSLVNIFLFNKNSLEVVHIYYMGQFLQDGENVCLMSYFFLKVKPLCHTEALLLRKNTTLNRHWGVFLKSGYFF